MATTPTTPAMPVTKWKHLYHDPKSSLRQLSIKGTRIKARSIFYSFTDRDDPQTVEEIATGRDIPIEAVKEALEYVATAPEVQQDWDFEEALIRLAGHYEPGSMGRAIRPIDPWVKERLRREIYGDVDEG